MLLLTRAILGCAVIVPLVMGSSTHATPGDPVAQPQVAMDEAFPTAVGARALLARAEEAVAAPTDARVAAIERLNVQSARQLIVALGEVETISAELARSHTHTTELRRLFKADEERVRLAGQATGSQSPMLLRHWRELPAQNKQEAVLDRIRARATTVEIARLDIADEISAIEESDARAEALLVAYPQASTSVQQLQRLLELRVRDYLTPLERATARQSELLAETETLAANFGELIERYRLFLSEHVLWLPNVSMVGAGEATELMRQVSALISPAPWVEAWQSLAPRIAQAPLRWAADVAIVLVLLLLRPRAWRFVRDSGERVGTPSDRFSATAKALAASALVAAPLPVALALLGVSVRATLVGGAADAVASAMLAVAGLVALLRWVEVLCARGGVAQCHFKWPDLVRGVLRRAAWVLLCAAVPLIFLCFAAIRIDEHGGGGALARWSIIAALLVMTGVSIRLFSPARGIFAPMIAAHPQGWLATLKPIWYLALVALPLLLAAAAAGGYVITAAAIVWRLSRTYWLILMIAIGLSLIARLGDSTLDRFGLRSDLQDPEEQQRAGEQVSRLVRLVTLLALVGGFFWAWSEILPAAGALGAHPLWSVSAGDGEPDVSVTLADVALALVAVVVTVALVRDLPGFLGGVVLRRFPLDASARYAIVALARYFLVLAGTIYAFSSLHIGWSNVQWLAAAVTVGLGFGLQEIFANFVSGLIMLAERPVSVGDMVTVDGVSGRIRQISTRATILVDMDNKDVIIPNKQFVTGRIVNWTLGSTPVRNTVVVGVAYGTDLDRAERILSAAVTGVGGVLATPSPMVLLSGFGASSIDFTVYYFVEHPRLNFTSRHELIARINTMFTQEGIVIAFPQLDVHLHRT